ncbi:MAG: hypothetical protein VXW87_00800 [Pseudomonadota bacterium]|nr:hypothetical protein [Pseudomonadota bacterium]
MSIGAKADERQKVLENDSLLSSSLSQYLAVIGFLLIYSILPQAYLVIAYMFYRILAVSMLFNIQFPDFSHSFLQKPIKKLIEQPGHVVVVSIDLLCSFQHVVHQLMLTLKNHKQIATVSLLAVVFIPNQLLFITQAASIYLLSLFSYQVGSLVAVKGFKWLSRQEGSHHFLPSQYQKQYLDKLNIAQMKLVTMFLVSVTTFLPLSYAGAILLFTCLPFMMPFMVLAVRYGFNHIFKQFLLPHTQSNAVDNKVVKSCILGFSLIFLLVNYKYEHHIINFLLAMYSSVLIGRLSSDFYTLKLGRYITSGDQILDLVYNTDIIHAFWAMCLMYEVSFVVFIPRILFIIAAIISGIDINLIPNTVLLASTTVYRPISNAMQYIEEVSSFSILCQSYIPTATKIKGLAQLFSPQKTLDQRRGRLNKSRLVHGQAGSQETAYSLNPS